MHKKKKESDLYSEKCGKCNLGVFLFFRQCHTNFFIIIFFNCLQIWWIVIAISSIIAFLLWPFAKVEGIGCSDLDLLTWLSRIKVHVRSEATSFSHMFYSKQGVSSQTHTTSSFLQTRGNHIKLFSLSLWHRFGLCLTLHLYNLFPTVIY